MKRVSERERESKTTRRIFALSEQLLLRLRSVWTQAWWWCYSCVLSLLILFFLFPHNYPMIAWLYNSFANITFFFLRFLYWFDSTLHGGCSGVSHWLHLLAFDYCSHSRGHFNSCTWTRNYNKLTSLIFLILLTHSRIPMDSHISFVPSLIDIQPESWVWITISQFQRWLTVLVALDGSSWAQQACWRARTDCDINKLNFACFGAPSILWFYFFFMHSVETKSSNFTHEPHSDGKWLIGDRGGWTN